MGIRKQRASSRSPPHYLEVVSHKPVRCASKKLAARDVEFINMSCATQLGWTIQITSSPLFLVSLPMMRSLSHTRLQNAPSVFADKITCLSKEKNIMCESERQRKNARSGADCALRTLIELTAA
jgi:hypothetical protein